MFGRSRPDPNLGGAAHKKKRSRIFPLALLLFLAMVCLLVFRVMTAPPSELDKTIASSNAAVAEAYKRIDRIQLGLDESQCLQFINRELGYPTEVKVFKQWQKNGNFVYQFGYRSNAEDSFRTRLCVVDRGSDTVTLPGLMSQTYWMP